MKKHTSSSISDNTGIASAILCTIHCLIIPALFLAKFWWADSSGATLLPSWWGRLDYVFLVISFWAVYHSATHTAVKTIKVSLWIFWCMLAVAIIYEAQLHWLAYIASAGLVATHIRNIIRIRRQQTAAIVSA